MNFEREEKTGANYCLVNEVVDHYLNSLLATNLTPAVVSLLAKAFLAILILQHPLLSPVPQQVSVFFLPRSAEMSVIRHILLSSRGAILPSRLVSSTSAGVTPEVASFTGARYHKDLVLHQS